MTDVLPATSIDRAASRARWSVWVLFALNALGNSVWAAHIPMVVWGLHLTPVQLGTVLVSMASGLVLGMVVFPSCIRLIGNRRATLALIAALPAALLALSLGSGPVTLAIAAATYGFVSGQYGVAMNVHAVEVQRRLGRPIIGSCHALWSGAAIVGTVFSGVCIGYGWSPLATFGLAAAVLAVGGLFAALGLVPMGTQPRHGADRRRRGRTPGRVWLLGLVAGGAMMCEGAAMDWAGVHLHGQLGASMQVATFGYGAYSATMALGRLASDVVVRRVGAFVVVRGGGLVAAGGIVVVVTAGSPLVAVAGWALTGIGLAGVVPLLFTAAGDERGCAPDLALARVSAVGYLGLLIGPAIIGATATRVTVGGALSLLAVVLVAIGVLGARLVRPRTSVPEIQPT